MERCILKKVVFDFTVEMDRSLFLQLVSISEDKGRCIDTVVHDLLVLALYDINHGVYPFDEWINESLITDCNAD